MKLFQRTCDGGGKFFKQVGSEAEASWSYWQWIRRHFQGNVRPTCAKPHPEHLLAVATLVMGNCVQAALPVHFRLFSRLKNNTQNVHFNLTMYQK